VSIFMQACDLDGTTNQFFQYKLFTFI